MVITPGLQPVAPLKSRPRLIILDGLDESKHPNVQCALRTAAAHRFRHISLQFLIASRSEAHVLRDDPQANDDLVTIILNICDLKLMRRRPSGVSRRPNKRLSVVLCLSKRRDNARPYAHSHRYPKISQGYLTKILEPKGSSKPLHPTILY